VPYIFNDVKWDERESWTGLLWSEWLHKWCFKSFLTTFPNY